MRKPHRADLLHSESRIEHGFDHPHPTREVFYAMAYAALAQGAFHAFERRVGGLGHIRRMAIGEKTDHRCPQRIKGRT
jgi:hypothetical protein